jgi:uncharacterized protein DUF4166
VSADFAGILGPDFARLPPSVRRLHLEPATKTYLGEADIVRGSSWLGRLIGFVAMLPPAARGIPLSVEIEPRERDERWTRHFGMHVMRSRLWRAGDRLREQLGPTRFEFALSVENERIVWRAVGVSALGIPLPSSWFRDVRAEEFERDGRYRFAVDAALPLVGLLVRYEGWLDVP